MREDRQQRVVEILRAAGDTESLRRRRVDAFLAQGVLPPTGVLIPRPQPQNRARVAVPQVLLTQVASDLQLYEAELSAAEAEIARLRERVRPRPELPA